jgi:hypothetical protein
MTEADWNACTHPTPMLEFLRQRGGKASDRKLRLFACACCRRIWPHFIDSRSRRLVEVAEAFADGLADGETLQSAFDDSSEAQDAVHWEGGDAVEQGAAEAVLGLRAELNLAAVLDEVDEVVGEYAAGQEWDRINKTPDNHWSVRDREHREVFERGVATERVVQTILLRDVVGPRSFRPLPPLDPDWLSWNGGIVRQLAEAMYAKRDFTPEWMGVLGAALLDAGCTDAEILKHCGGPGPHTRGYWVVDTVLGKE